MSTHCGNPAPHGAHDWKIDGIPGEPGPDWFRCEPGPTILAAGGWCAPRDSGLNRREHWADAPSVLVQAARDAQIRPPAPRTFDLLRFHDVSGVSGVGVVAQGVKFPDGSVAVRWPGEHASTAVWGSVEALLAVHGHNGLTVARFHDGED